MDLIIAESFIKKVFDDFIDDCDLNSAGIIIYELQAKFNYNILDIYEILYKCPMLLKNYKKTLSNISHLSSIFNLKDIEIKILIKKIPSVLLLDFEIVRYKIDLISATYGCSIKDALKLLTQIPNLLNLTKEFIISQNKIFSQTLNQYGLKYRTVLKFEPMLLFVTKNQIIECKKCLMKEYTLSEEESQLVLVDSPSLMVSGINMLIKKFDFYYPKYFIKRDLKEILSRCHTFLTLDEELVKQKISNIKESFLLSDKQVYRLIRQEPNLLFFDNISARINNFAKYSISSSYILTFPSVCMVPEISVPLKFVITRIIGLEQMFNKVCDIDSNLFISRFLFMQSNQLFEHKDLVLSEQLFLEKYQISSKVLLLSYNIDGLTLNRICKFYLDSKHKIKNWVDIIFPDFENILEYVNNGYTNRLINLNGYYFKRVSNLQTSREYKINKLLCSLQLSEQEICFIMNKNNILGKFLCSDVKKIIDELRKYGYNQEQIIKLMFEKQHLFNYNIVDFCCLIEQIIKDEKCSEFDVIEKYL